MNNEQDLRARIEELAKFLDPAAFDYEPNGPLSHRREAALEKARNRIALALHTSAVTNRSGRQHARYPGP